MEGRPDYSELEEHLRDEVAWRKLLIEESRDGIVIVNKDAEVVEANRQFANMLGYSMEEIRQLHVWDWDTVFTKEQILGLAAEVSDAGHHFETRHRRKDGVLIDVELCNNGIVYRGEKYILCISRDITERLRAAREREELVERLQEALAEIKSLHGILPLCSFCKKISDDEGHWEQVDVYIAKHTEAQMSHSVCPECMKKHYPEFSDEE